MDVRRPLAHRPRAPAACGGHRRRRAAHPVRRSGRAPRGDAVLRLLQGAARREAVVRSARRRAGLRHRHLDMGDRPPRAGGRARAMVGAGAAAVPGAMHRDLSRGPAERRPDHPERFRVHRHPRRLGDDTTNPGAALADPGACPHRPAQHVPHAVLRARDRSVRHDDARALHGDRGAGLLRDRVRHVEVHQRGRARRDASSRRAPPGEGGGRAVAGDRRSEVGDCRPHGCGPRRRELRVGRHGRSLLPDSSALHHGRPGPDQRPRVAAQVLRRVGPSGGPVHRVPGPGAGLARCAPAARPRHRVLGRAG